MFRNNINITHKVDNKERYYEKQHLASCIPPLNLRNSSENFALILKLLACSDRI